LFNVVGAGVGPPKKTLQHCHPEQSEGSKDIDVLSLTKRCFTTLNMTATRKQHSIVIQGKEFQKIAVVKRFFALLRMTEPQNLSCWNEVKHLTRGLVIPSELNDEGSQ